MPTTSCAASRDSTAKTSTCLYSNRDVDLRLDLPDNFEKRVLAMPVSNLWLQTALPLDLARKRVDVFHGTNFVVPLVAATRRVSTVYDLSSFLFPDMHTTANNLVQRLVPASVRASRRVIAVSEHTKQDLIRLWNVPAEKIRVVPGAAGEEFRPIDDAAGLERFRAEKNLPGRFVLFVGTLEPRKNIGAIFDAMKLLKNEGLNGYKLVVIGEKGWRYGPIFDRVHSLGMDDDVQFVGYQGWDVLPYFYNLARMLLFPSFYEGFGLPPLESMACGTPAIVGDNSSLKEVVADDRLRVDPRNPRDLADAVARLMTDEDVYRTISSQGRRRASEFSWEKVARQTLDVYREAAR